MWVNTMTVILKAEQEYRFCVVHTTLFWNTIATLNSLYLSQTHTHTHTHRRYRFSNDAIDGNVMVGKWSPQGSLDVWGGVCLWYWVVVQVCSHLALLAFNFGEHQLVIICVTSNHRSSLVTISAYKCSLKKLFVFA